MKRGLYCSKATNTNQRNDKKPMFPAATPSATPTTKISGQFSHKKCSSKHFQYLLLCLFKRQLTEFGDNANVDNYDKITLWPLFMDGVQLPQG